MIGFRRKPLKARRSRQGTIVRSSMWRTPKRQWRESAMVVSKGFPFHEWFRKNIFPLYGNGTIKFIIAFFKDNIPLDSDWSIDIAFDGA
jgi:hypothetical protein